MLIQEIWFEHPSGKEQGTVSTLELNQCQDLTILISPKGSSYIISNTHPWKIILFLIKHNN